MSKPSSTNEVRNKDKAKMRLLISIASANCLISLITAIFEIRAGIGVFILFAQAVSVLVALIIALSK